jgi:hypothetical protein
MKKNIKLVPAIITMILILSLPIVGRAQENELIQMAILLDTSSSMDGLIEQAKSQLWKIVNELALARKNGKSPKLEVALYEYGKSSIPSSEGYIRMITSLTTDLDRVSEELFKLRTNGGDEYCGRVIRAATEGLKWSINSRDLKVIFIAGNEPFTQGEVDYRVSVREAISKGIIVNTIFCGNYQEGVNTGWKHGAELADGRYMNIDQNQKIIHIEAPQDEEIIRLGRELNKTYIAYGRKGKVNKERQKKQDLNAAEMNEETLIQRTAAKASKHYINSGWDLVDAVQTEKVAIESLRDEDLPDEMKKMSKKERSAYINKTIEKRRHLQKRINQLDRERRKYIDGEMRKSSDQNTLDAAIIKTIQEQALRKEYRFE